MKLKKIKQYNKTIPYSTMSDISFLLIIFFIVTSIFIVHQGFPLILPGKKNPPKIVKQDEVLIFNLLEDKIIYKGNIIAKYNGDSIKYSDKLIKTIVNKNKGKICIFYISGKTKYGFVVKFVDILKDNGIYKFSFKSKKNSSAYIDFLKQIEKGESKGK